MRMQLCESEWIEKFSRTRMLRSLILNVLLYTSVYVCGWREVDSVAQFQWVWVICVLISEVGNSGACHGQGCVCTGVTNTVWGVINIVWAGGVWGGWSYILYNYVEFCTTTSTSPQTITPLSLSRVQDRYVMCVWGGGGSGNMIIGSIVVCCHHIWYW